MTTEQVREYLEKQLFIENTVVTYRLLSRELGIHVDDARLELQKYRSMRKDVHATYIIIGTRPPRGWEEKTGSETVQERLMLLVSEDELDDSKSDFYIIDSIDVYSLSAVFLIDADLVCKERDRVRELDARDTTGELAKKVGRIIGRHVKKRKPIKRNLKGKGHLGAASTVSKQPTVKKDATIKKDPTAKEEPKKATKELAKEKSRAPVEKKPTKAGTLDWSKAKSKVEKEKEKADELRERAETEAREAKAKREKDKEEKEKGEPKVKPVEVKSAKRGVKRKTGALEVSDSEQSAKPPSPEPPKGAKLKGRVIFSDEEESDEPKPRKGKGRASPQSSDVEELGRSVRAMMDIDDEEVEKVTVTAPTKPPLKSKSKSMVVESSDEEEHTEPADGEDSMYVDDEPAEVKRKKPRKKAEKKVVPVGRNGLKKKRVVKSRMSTDAKGYMVTEDYSSYESVDEEEPEEQPKPKKKLASKPSESKLKPKASSSKDTKAPSKEIKKRASMGGGLSKSATGQGSLTQYFKKS